MNDTKLDDTTGRAFKEDLSKQATEALKKAFLALGITKVFDLEVGIWRLDAEIVWYTGQESLRRVWEGWVCFRMHIEDRPGCVLPLLSVVNEGKVTFPNLDQVVQAICQTG